MICKGQIRLLYQSEGVSFLHHTDLGPGLPITQIENLT